MVKRIEQIDSHDLRGGYRKFLKLLARRRRRRDERKRLEDAATKNRYQGYSR